ncbi:MAG: DUF4231 domain-containing protein [Cyanobium sp.]
MSAADDCVQPPLNPATQALEALRPVLDQDIQWFDREANAHKRIYRTCATAVIALTAATTITASLGLAVDARHARTLQFIVIALTATTTGVTAWAEMRRARELWRHEREVGYALKDIRRELSYRSATSSLTRKDVDDYFARACSIIGSSSDKWSRIHEKSLAAAQAVAPPEAGSTPAP